jgi:predicted ATPase/DNA-binding SARP family transcriptional activator
VAAGSVEFRLLGSLEATRDGEQLQVGGPKHRTLLAALLLHANEPVSVDALAEALWPERPPEKFDSTIQVYVSQLRRELGREAIVRRGAGYVLAAEPRSVDSLRFERLAAEGLDALAGAEPARARRVLGEALALWRGPALADFRYEAFALPHAERLEELRLAALEARVDADLELGGGAELVPELHGLVAEHPLREGLRRELMLALYRSGRQADALEAYRTARRTLVDELGIEPSPELQELNRRILAQDPALQPALSATETNVARPPVPVLGREGELERLLGLLRSGETRLVTLTGPGGVGKTTLALEAASAVQREFKDGACFVDLSSIDDPSLVESAVATTLGASGALAEHLGDKRLLLVLDNFEQVVESGPAVAALLAACPRLCVLVTSRERLRLRPETELVIGPLAAGDAVELFRARMGAVGSRVGGDDTGALEALCLRLDGLPLAIELAAARSKLVPPGDLLARLDRSLALLTGGPRDAPERHRTLEATIEWSYGLLDEPLRALLRRLAVFAGSFTAEDAEAVCEADLDTLAELLDKSLVTRRAEPGPLALLATVREFALRRLEAAGEAEAARSRHAEYVAAHVEREDDRLAGGDEAAALAAIAAKHDDVRAALGWAVARADGALARRLVAAVGWFWFLRSTFTEGRRWVDAALALPPEPRTEVDATALMRAGAIADAQGDLAAAGRFYADALGIRRSLGDTAATANALNNVGNVSIRTGDLAAARRSYEESLALARAGSRPLAVGSALHGLASVQLGEGDAASAIPLLEEALAVAEAADDRYGVEVVCEVLGAAATELGQADEATRHLARAVGLALELGHWFGVAAALDVLAALAIDADDAETAARRLGAAAAIGRDLGSERGHFEAARALRTERAARAALGDDAFEAAFRETAGLSLDEAGAVAVAAVPIGV